MPKSDIKHERMRTTPSLSFTESSVVMSWVGRAGCGHLRVQCLADSGDSQDQVIRRVGGPRVASACNWSDTTQNALYFTCYSECHSQARAPGIDGCANTKLLFCSGTAVQQQFRNTAQREP